MAKQKPQTEEIEEVDFISTELKKFNILDATIAEWSGKFMPLKIDGIKDKEGYEKVREARLFIKGRRVEVEKTSKLLKADALTFQRAVNEEEKRIIALLDPIEEHLYHQEANFEAEKQRIKEEKERQEQQRFNQRNSLLLTNGCAFNGDSYSIADLSIMQSDIRYISDEAFDGFLDKVKVEHEKELEAKSEAERLQREETERLKAEREELEKMRAEQEKQRQEIQRQKDEIEAEKNRQVQAKIDHENKVRADEQAKQHAIELKKAQDEAAKKAKSDLLEKQKQEAERKAEADRKAKARAERLEALKPVKQKLTDFANMVSSIEIPALNDVEGDEILKQAKGLLEKVSNYINEKTQNL